MIYWLDIKVTFYNEIVHFLLQLWRGELPKGGVFLSSYRIQRDNIGVLIEELAALPSIGSMRMEVNFNDSHDIRTETLEAMHTIQRWEFLQDNLPAAMWHGRKMIPQADYIAYLRRNYALFLETLNRELPRGTHSRTSNREMRYQRDMWAVMGLGTNASRFNGQKFFDPDVLETWFNEPYRPVAACSCSSGGRR